MRSYELSVTVTLSQSKIEKLLSILDENERTILEARSMLSSSSTINPVQTASQPKTPSIKYVKWRVKGGSAAGPSDDFAFDFTQDRDGNFSRDKAPIIDYIKQKGPFQVDGYEVNLSKDGKFLQRKRV